MRTILSIAQMRKPKSRKAWCFSYSHFTSQSVPDLGLKSSSSDFRGHASCFLSQCLEKCNTIMTRRRNQAILEHLLPARNFSMDFLDNTFHLIQTL